MMPFIITDVIFSELILRLGLQKSMCRHSGRFGLNIVTKEAFSQNFNAIFRFL